MSVLNAVRNKLILCVYFVISKNINKKYNYSIA